MLPPLRLLLTIFCVTLCSFNAQAEIVWKQTSAALHADAKSTALEARFPFSNVGGAPVDITQVASSCGCTTANLQKRHYEPRESGEVVARYTVGAQTGTLTKTILVETNDGRAPTTLTLEIYLPEIVRILPASLHWKHGETPTPKTLTLEVLQDVPAKAVAVESRSAAFNAQVVALTPGRKFEVAVRPNSTDQPQFSTLNIRCRFGDQEKVYTAYADVQTAETKD